MSLPCDLALASCFKGQHQYLTEWIAFHKVIGFEHFFLVSNEEDSSSARNILSPWIEEGIITYIERWPSDGLPQCCAFDHVLQLARGKVNWIAFLDNDEFLVPVVGEDLRGFFTSFDKDPIGGMLMCWATYMSGGHETPPDDLLQIEAYTQRVIFQHDISQVVKSVVRPEVTVRSVGSHFFEYKPGFVPVNEFGNEVPQLVERLYPATHKRVRVNHYITRSKRDYAEKIKRGWPRGGGQKVTEEERWKIWNTFHSYPSERDVSALRFVERTRAEMKRVGR